MHAFTTHTNTSSSGAPPPQLVRSTGIARRPRRPAPAAPAVSTSTTTTTTTQPPAAAARRRDYRSEQDLLRGNDDGGASGSTTPKPARAWRTWPTAAPPTLIPAPAPATQPPASLAIGAVGQQTPQIRHQLQSRRSFAARVEASAPGPATAPRGDGGRGGGRDAGPDGEDEVALLTGGRIPRSFSTSAQTRVAAVHRRRGVEGGKGPARRGGMGGGLPIIAETTTTGAHGASVGGSRAAPAAVVAVPATDEGGGGGETPPRLPFLAFSGTGHLSLQDGDVAARAARKNALLAELYALETQSAAAAGGGGQETDAHGVGTPHERERQIIAELMDLVHEYAVVEENRYLPGEQRHDRERGQGGAVVELPAYDTRSYTFPQPAYSRRPVWPGPQTHPQQQPQAPSPELYASEPWAVKPRRPGVPVIGLGNVMHGRRQDQVHGEEGQSSRSLPAKRSEFQVQTLFRESMLEARQRQEEEEAMMAEQRVGGLHEAPAGSPSPSSSYPSSTGLPTNTAAAVGGSSADFAVEQTLPSIYMIRPTGREPPEPTLDPRYNANLDETRLTPPGAPKAKMRRRLAGLRGHGLDDAPEVVTAEMLGVPEIAAAAAAAEQKVEVEGAQCRSLEPGEQPLPTMRRQGSGRQGLGARNSLKKSWRSFWNLR